MAEETDEAELSASQVGERIAGFPQTKARTLRFTLGAPRSIRMAGDGRRAFFLRSDGPEDFETSLWMSVFDQGDGHREVLLADPRDLLADAAQEQVPAEERARRERSREGGRGIVAYSVDAAGHRLVFTLGSRLWLTQLDSDGLGASTRSLTLPAELGEGHAILNPEISADGTRVAYTTGRQLAVVTIGADPAADAARVVLALEDGAGEEQKLGLAEFVAGEEMDRYQGFWWSPASDALLVESYDASPEPVWYISDPAEPSHPGQSRRYAQALTANAKVRLLLVRLGSDGSASSLVRVDWDHKAYEYLAVVRWQAKHEPLLLLQNRRQTRDQIAAVELGGGQQEPGADCGTKTFGFDDLPDLPSLPTRSLREHENDRWLDLVPGLPAWTPDGRLAEAVIDEGADTIRLALDGQAFSPVGCQLREVLDLGESDALAVVSSDPRSFDLVRFGYDGSLKVLNSRPGVWTASRAGRGIVVSGRTMQEPGVKAWHSLLAPGASLDALACCGEARPQSGVEASARLTSQAADPGFTPNVDFVRLGADQLFGAVVRPSESSPWAGEGKLPVLLKPYGGPGFQQVVFSQSYYWESQWWADQGFIVLTADGHGTTGRGPAWDRAIFEDMAQVTLDDQVAAVQALPDLVPQADLSRVAMIGWSYGGFLSALSVLRAPDVVHAACAGAPPTDWTLYDTHYTERYLGLDREVYRRNSIIDDAPKLRRPLMLIHGFADDNVSVANTLRLSQALMAAGRPHTVLPLTGITHMTNDPTVARNLLVLQRDFLYQALGIQPRD
ncbi:Xaa-Pro dipeptidyl-peptidase [Bifidobacterium actinocoloniiforme DSM 22766]|uniref:Xaa-Pro dipeptidyl-peptidase n=1 Tax=Bifidobacterium actinocoloniiforme DSM 22766 TaxID=1437605 RepID=A0A086YWE7_9BIFI|nr:prolyl oligopeptidase family serine peptidase [Bifidobacterium actinocoloniiforme]AKV55796.1 cytochrome C [Bifidobacterium actinocoloniiforme DSM 22766]KFI38597.1 Xaa-Pro dipeptidyl-peptidase [Bifidobacterium actinocoloniiforme DSM 22766]